jgi:hypothetical protein
MKVILETDEWYPVYTVGKKGFEKDVVDIPTVLVERFGVMIVEFNAIQDELAAIVEAMKPTASYKYYFVQDGWWECHRKSMEVKVWAKTKEAAYFGLQRKFPEETLPAIEDIPVTEPYKWVELT